MLKELQMIDASTLGLLGIHGAGAKALLQGQLTCHMDEVNHTNFTFAALCNPKGRVICFGRIFLYQDSYYLQMPLETVPIAMKALQKYAVFFKATLSDDSQKFSRVIYQNPTTTCNDGLILPFNQTFHEYIGTTAISSTNSPALSWQNLDILAKIPNIYPETSEKFLPHELNLHEINAIHFNKGCYTGQEIIARMQYRGKLKTKLYQGQTHQKPSRGDDVFDDTGKTAGMIVDFCQNNADHYDILFTSQNQGPHFLNKEKTQEILL
ncbi:MAG TPA: hypothetical protein VHM20_04835 [Gammaproteobacteria bacterium]|jgi:hypothetical protein|nr:hypothetical protein [Gammaproteobacteria bacterium]